ncbi:MAG: T9SS type A sorting domain-containing protein [Paludibacteraceae bacterium]|nr:T9SS type A sorting domain-containing protein [Paludibacteraceae bacterium]
MKTIVNIFNTLKIMKTQNIKSVRSMTRVSALLLMMLVAVNAIGQTVVDISEAGTIKATNITVYSQGGSGTGSNSVCSFSASACYKNTSGSVTYISINSGDSFTIAATSGYLSKIVISPYADGGGTAGRINVDTGTWNGNNVWTADNESTASVTFTATNTVAFQSFTFNITHSISTTAIKWNGGTDAINITCATGGMPETELYFTGTSGYYVTSCGVTGDFGENTVEDDYYSSSTLSPLTISVLAKEAGNFTGQLELDITSSDYSLYSHYEIIIPITLTVTGCTDIRTKEAEVSASTPTYNCSTGYWESTISWNAISGATKYNVRMMEYNGSAFAYIGNWYDAGTNLSYTYTNLETGKEYRAKVVADNQNCSTIDATNDNHTLYGSGQGASDDFETTCPTVDVIAEATGVLANSANITVLADGDLCSNMKYAVVVSTNSDYSSPVYNVSNQTAETYSVSGLASQTKYYYKVTATNECGNSGIYEDNFTTSKALVDYRYMCIDLELRHSDYLTSTAPVMITSAGGQKVKGERTLELIILGTTAGATVSLSGTDLLFYKTDGSSASTLTTDGTGSLTETIVVAYAPTAYTSESFATPDISVSCEGNNLQFPGLVTGRCLPDQFVIAAKAGSEWVALTAKITKSQAQDAVPIMVDKTTTPTRATVAMNTSEYSLLSLQTDKPSVARNRFGYNGTAVHLLSSQTSKVLNATTSTSSKVELNTYATHDNAASSTDSLFYEWKLVSTDLVHYTITNSNRTTDLANNLILGYGKNTGKWGMYPAANANQDIFILPITDVLTDMDVEVMEWATDGMALRFTGTAPSTVKVTLGGSTSAAKTLTQIGSSDIYTVSDLSLTSNDCQVMMLTDGADNTKGALIRKPILVNDSANAVGSTYRTNLTDEVCASCDIIVLNGGKLTADQAKTNHTDFANIHVYPGGKLVLDAQSLGVKQQVYVRGGYSWLNTTTYALPELYINGNINFNGSAKIIYDYYIQNYKYYQFCLPYSVPLAKVTDEMGVDNFPVWVKHYNGALRAADANATSWAWYGEDPGQENFEAGIGYIIAARPRQEAGVQNRPLSIIRFPLTNNVFNGSGEADKEVSTTAHGIEGYNAGTVTANNVGWNFVGNPFMATWKGDIGHKQLQPEGGEEHWTGAYEWVDAATKYITVMSPEDGHDYDQYVASNTELKPFFPFFMQETAAGGTGNISFSNTNRQKKLTSVVRNNEPREAFVQVDITDNNHTDQTGMYVSDKYSNELDFDDYEKVFGQSTDKVKVWLMHNNTRMAFESVNEERASGETMLGYRAPSTGKYVFSINEGSKLSEIEAVYLTDNVEGVSGYNLLLGAYEFTSDAISYNDSRFSISIILKDEQSDIDTDLSDLSAGLGLENVTVANTEGGIVLQGLPQNANVWLYDMTGKLVESRVANMESMLRFMVPTGVYNIRVQSGENGRTIRAIVK